MSSAPPNLPAARVSQIRRIRGVLAAGNQARSNGLGLESVQGLPADDAPLPRPDDVLARVDAILRSLPADEVGDPVAFLDAANTVLQHGERALQRLVVSPPDAEPAFDPDELGSLEALIIADGSRPSFLLREGKVADDDPFRRDWDQTIKGFETELKSVAAAVGRIQPETGHASFYIGTGTLVDATNMLVLTNYHVLDDARERFGIKITQTDSKTMSIDSKLLIDFAGESGLSQQSRFRVIEALLPTGAGRGFDGLDAAVLRIEALNTQSRLPSKAVLLSADVDLSTGASYTLCTVGFPGPPMARINEAGALLSPISHRPIWPSETGEMPWGGLPALRDGSFADIEKFVGKLEKVPLRLDLSRLDPQASRVLLRGSTLEFHRPLARALALLCGANGDSPRRNTSNLLAFDALVSFLDQTVWRSSSIVPRVDVSSKPQRHALARSLDSGFVALVMHMDRTRTLRSFCAQATEACRQLVDALDVSGEGAEHVQRICERFIRWDDALHAVCAPTHQ